MTLKQTLVVWLSAMSACGPAATPDEGAMNRGNPLYKGGKSGNNPIFESAHLVVDPQGTPVLVYAEKVIDNDALKTNVRVVRPDVEAENAASQLATDATPRALGTVRDSVHLLTEGDDGVLRSTSLKDTWSALTPLSAFTSLGAPGAVHQSVVSIKGLPFVALKAAGGDLDGQSLLVELGNAAPNHFAVGKAVGQDDVPFIAAGGETHREFAVAFEQTTVRSAVSQGNQLAASLDSGKTGRALAVWTDGAATKTLIDTADGVFVFDGKVSVALGQSGAALCRAGGFTVDGAPWLLTVTATETTLVTSDATALNTPTADYATGDLVDCTLAVAKAGVHGAWRLMRAPTDAARIGLDVIDYVQVPANGSAVLKTRHETAKNSINNVR